MSETVARQRPSINLDDFERRLQTQAHRHHDDDPLAELARIVGEQPDPYDDVFAQPQAAAPVNFRPAFDPHRRQEPSLGAPPPRFSADFSAIEAGLRGARSAPAPQAQAPQAYAGTTASPHTGYEQSGYADPVYGYEPEPQMHAGQDGSWVDPASRPARRGSRRPVYVMGASIAVAVVGIGIAFAYKGTGSSPREIKTIMAAAGPTKVQPPMDASADQAGQDAGAQQQTPTKLVSREEQPVDLSQAVQDNAARDAASRGADAASVPVPLSPGQAAGAAYPDYSVLGGAKPTAGADQQAGDGSASPNYGDQGFGVGMPRPKKVKSVSVRPDGTIVDAEVSASAPAPVPAQSNDRIGQALAKAMPSTPAPKVSNRASMRTAAAQPAEDVGAADDGADALPSKPAKPAKKAKPVHVATAETSATDATADAADETKPAGAGGFAVQLAAPGSEADARSTTSRLIKKYSSALHGRRLGFHRAESNGRTVYRVRVGSLTREDATSLCSKLKADGGTCFVAKD